jgi:hypothetical protein
MPDDETIGSEETRDPKAAWDSVGDHFAELGARFKEQFDARLAFEGRLDRERVEGAVKTLLDALDTAFRAVGDTVRDPSVQERVKRAADSLGDALQTSFDTVGDEVRRRFGSRSGSES